MDHYTIKALWIYWARGDAEVELTDEESSDSEDEDEVAKIFRIETNVFNFETPLCWRRWDDFDNTNHDNEESENEMEHEDEERCEVFDDHERPVCYIRRFKIVKYSFRDDEEYVAIRENEYDDLTNTSKEEIHAYQGIF
ncbi:hypothetical protein Tco_0453808 [Tanacetum coccineum]